MAKTKEMENLQIDMHMIIQTEYLNLTICWMSYFHNWNTYDVQHIMFVQSHQISMYTIKYCNMKIILSIEVKSRTCIFTNIQYVKPQYPLFLFWMIQFVLQFSSSATYYFISNQLKKCLKHQLSQMVYIPLFSDCGFNLYLCWRTFLIFAICFNCCHRNIIVNANVISTVCVWICWAL